MGKHFNNFSHFLDLWWVWFLLKIDLFVSFFSISGFTGMIFKKISGFMGMIFKKISGFMCNSRVVCICHKWALLYLQCATMSTASWTHAWLLVADVIQERRVEPITVVDVLQIFTIVDAKSTVLCHQGKDSEWAHEKERKLCAMSTKEMLGRLNVPCQPKRCLDAWML